MKKQSAVDYLIEQLESPCRGIPSFIIEKARGIQKEQMRLIYEGILQNVGTSIKQSDLPTFEQYYNRYYENEP